ncbi:MAG: nicotinamide riboside transporter PnuC [Sulfurimonas sp.]
MNFNLQTILDAFAAMPLLEVIAVTLGITYVVLAAKESVWCWIAGFFSTLIYTYIFIEGKLYFSSILNLFYMGMSIYGFILWEKGVKQEETKLKVTSWSYRRQVTAILGAAVSSFALALFFGEMLNARMPYLDASVTVFSMLATWMLAHKILQTWIFWVVIDSAAITLYWSTGFHVTIILFMFYILLSFYGYTSWQKSRVEA